VQEGEGGERWKGGEGGTGETTNNDVVEKSFIGLSLLLCEIVKSL